MSYLRPPECPACGHERIARRPQPRRTETGALRVTIAEWTCQLCDYAWSYPIRARRDEFVEAD